MNEETKILNAQLTAWAMDHLTDIRAQNFENAALTRRERIQAEREQLKSLARKVAPRVKAAFGDASVVSVDICDYGNYAALYLSVGKTYAYRSAREVLGADPQAVAAAMIDEVAGHLQELVKEAEFAKVALDRLEQSRAPSVALSRAFKLTLE